MSKFSQIIAFTQVIQQGSFAAAAKLIGVTAAAISKQVSALEAELGVELIIRDTRNVSLSEFGREYYAQCLRIIQEVEASEQLISELKSEPSGHLKVTCALFLREKFIFPYLHEFFKAYPKIRIDFEFNERMPDLHSEEVDIIVGMSARGDEDYVRKLLGSTRYVLVASKTYFQKNQPPKNVKDLSEHSFLTHTIRENRDTIRFRSGDVIRIHPFLATNDSHSLKEFVKRDLGVASILHYVVKDELKNGELVEILKKDPLVEAPVYLFYRKSRYLSAKVRAFIDFFSDKISLA